MFFRQYEDFLEKNSLYLPKSTVWISLFRAPSPHCKVRRWPMRNVFFLILRNTLSVYRRWSKRSPFRRAKEHSDTLCTRTSYCISQFSSCSNQNSIYSLTMFSIPKIQPRSARWCPTAQLIAPSIFSAQETDAENSATIYFPSRFFRVCFMSVYALK